MSSATQTCDTPAPDTQRQVERKRPRPTPVVIVREGEDLNPAQVALRGFCFGLGFTGAVLVLGLCAWRVHQADAAE